MIRTSFRRASLALALSALAVPVAGAELSEGRELYVESCASCHGLDGRGGGPRAATLAAPPPDLTRLHERYGTPLPRDRIAAFIDGRSEVEAHGPREMPVWGKRFFEGDPGPPRGVESAKRRSIELIVDYLQQLQGMEQTRR
jgi:mono/diheme cytochrome c family protein